nr:heavy metal-binding domain-containing protein [Candidatus Brachybacter algidus]
MEVAEKVVYQCPMDCEKGKTYEVMGICPVCKMDLAKVEEKSGRSA